MSAIWDDHTAIRDLASNYAAAASQKDLQGIAGVFTENCRVKGLTIATQEQHDLVGPETVCSYLGRLFDGIEHVTQVPHTGNIVVVGDTATAVCDIVEYIKYRGVDGFTLAVARYDDCLRRTPAGWRFSERTLSVRIFQPIV